MPQLQTGVYSGTIKGQRVGETPNKRTPCIYLTIEIDKGIQSDGVTYDFPQPQTRTLSMLITDNSAQYTAADLQTLGFNGQPSQIDPSSPNHISLVGTRAQFYNQIKNDYENWRVNRPRGSSNERPSMDSAALLDLDAKFGNHFNVAPAPATAPVSTDASAAPAATSDTSGDGDIPF